MRKRKYVALHGSVAVGACDYPMPQCHNIVSTSQINVTDCPGGIDLARIAHLYPFTSYDKKRFAAITIRLAHPHCTCLLFGSGKLVITGSTSYHACIVATQAVTQLLSDVYPLSYVAMSTCIVQNIVAHVEFPAGSFSLRESYHPINFMQCSLRFGVCRYGH